MAGSPGAAVQLPPSQWQYLKDLNTWIAQPSTWLYGRWNQPASAAEGGVDLNSPAGTPVFALADGTVVGVGKNNVDGNDVVTTRINVPGYGPQDLFYQHIVKNSHVPLQVGDTVHYGEYIGDVADTTNMGWTPHVELGFNSGWGGPWGNNHPAGWVTDPRPLLKNLVDAHPHPTVIAPNGTPTATNTGLNANAVAGPPPNPIQPLIDFLTKALPSIGVKIGLFVLALVLVVIGAMILLHKDVGAVARTVAP